MLKGIGKVIKFFACNRGWQKSQRLADRRVLSATLKTIRSSEFSRSRLTGCQAGGADE